MAWPIHLPAVFPVRASPSRVAGPRPLLHLTGVPPARQSQVWRGHFYQKYRGKRRIFADPEYRFYRSNTGPPQEGDAPFDTAASLPHTPTDTFADGTWYLSMSYFNGMVDSGFLPFGANGETYRVLIIDGGEATVDPPQPPIDWGLEQRAGGIIRVIGMYNDLDMDRRAHEWSIAYVNDPTMPDPDDPDHTIEMDEIGLDVIAYDLPAVAHGTIRNVLIQTRRNDGTVLSPDWVYSASEIKSLAADADGPGEPTSIYPVVGIPGTAPIPVSAVFFNSPRRLVVTFDQTLMSEPPTGFTVAIRDNNLLYTMTSGEATAGFLWVKNIDDPAPVSDPGVDAIVSYTRTGYGVRGITGVPVADFTNFVI